MGGGKDKRERKGKKLAQLNFWAAKLREGRRARVRSQSGDDAVMRDEVTTPRKSCPQSIPHQITQPEVLRCFKLLELLLGSFPTVYHPFPVVPHPLEFPC